ncbi:hypothetical protein Taro_001408 [Colocasia esculenta]|uniref:Uncharacterized protein n=1 Tax=Colocasia esculenta TaxID=4460 RepID=A0A843TG67_COLES|nr:hypothetical protein [Colocasia esculenta]
MEKYFGNPYRGDPGVPHTEPESFVNIWIGSFAFSAITWFNPYLWQLSNQFKSVAAWVRGQPSHIVGEVRGEFLGYNGPEWNKYMDKPARESYYYNWPVYFP